MRAGSSPVRCAGRSSSSDRRTMTTLTDLGSGLGVYRGQRIAEQARNSSERWTKAALSPSKLAATIALTLVIRSAGGIAWAVTGGSRA